MAQSAAPTAFDAVTIKPSKTFVGGMGMGRGTPDGISLINVSARALIANAYGVKPDLIQKGPGWMDSEEYDIEAKVLASDPGHPPRLNPKETKSLIRAMLADRFQLKLHTETRQLPVYDLVIAKSGTKFKEARPGDTYPNGIKFPNGAPGVGMMMLMDRKFTGQAIPISGLVDTLENELHRTVIDRTGLTGKYDITLQLPREPRLAATPQPDDSAPLPDNGPSIFTLVEEQLGLKLNSTTGPVQVLVIDHIAKPSAN